MGDGVRVGIERAVGTITLTRPGTLNALDSGMLLAITGALRTLDTNPDVRAIAITGTDRAFCAGASLGLGPGGVDLPDHFSGVLELGGDLIKAIVATETTTVALVNGVAAGMGVGIALACDYVAARESAVFMLALSRVGLALDGGTSALVAANIGRSRALRLALTGEPIAAEVANRWGMVAELVPDEAWDDRCGELTRTLAAGAPRSLAACSRLINEATLDLDAALERERDTQYALFATKDAVEGITAFVNKRAPNFGGK